MIYLLLILVNFTNCYQKLITYIDKVSSWNNQQIILQDLGVPGYSSHNYDHINLAFWISNLGATDIALLWENADSYFNSTFGSNKSEIQLYIKELYKKQNIKLLVSAFGSTDNPTSQDPELVCGNLGNFVIENNLDGVDLDYEDNVAMENGIGEDWLIKCTQKLRQLLPTQLISHAPQAPYFMGVSKYKNGAYITVNQNVGQLIDYYNIQFYNQGNSGYDSYQSLFETSDGWALGTSVQEIVQKGINIEKIIVGKPVLQSDATNTGWVDPQNLKVWADQAKQKFQWDSGFMSWQFSSDDGSFSQNIQ